jgi:hypothetical protein
MAINPQVLRKLMVEVGMEGKAIEGVIAKLQSGGLDKAAVKELLSTTFGQLNSAKSNSMPAVRDMGRLIDMKKPKFLMSKEELKAIRGAR